MKNSILQYSRQERSGLTTFVMILLLFFSFLFIQKTQFNTPVELVIVQHSESDENTPNSDGKKNKEYTGSLETSNQLENEASIEKIPRNYGNKELVTNNKNQQEDNTYPQRKKYQEKNDMVSKNYEESNNYQYKPKVSEPVSLNEPNPEKWQKLRGIGPVFSERIIKFKNYLGGFHSVEQLQEVYGMTDSLYNVITPFIIIDNNYAQIDINISSVKQLASHPYIDWKLAKRLVAYRDQHGMYSSIKDLYNLVGIESEVIEKIKPYFLFDESSLASNN